jgi:hypothetical protein
VLRGVRGAWWTGRRIAFPRSSTVRSMRLSSVLLLIPYSASFEEKRTILAVGGVMNSDAVGRRGAMCTLDNIKYEFR